MAFSDAPDISMDPSALYREETYTDQRVGTLRVMTPVDINGDRDPGRDLLFVGSAQIMTPAGALPISFELDAANLAEAVEKFGPAAQKALEQTIEELKEMQREAASSIVVPKAGGGMPGAGGLPGGGGMPGGGIQIP